ncbi:MAG TPA: hypothetical protein VFW92_07405 [Candidatus Limnocylindrales bacterium]|nr:hypothetical protein [Candidatus Limnocylindrales bacterium]
MPDAPSYAHSSPEPPSRRAPTPDAPTVARATPPNQLPLPLDLAAGEPRLPADLRPMLARSVPRLPDDGRHLYDPSWGGVRVLAYVQEGAVRLVAARGRDLTARLPEVAAALATALAAAGPCLLDGELVAPDADGRLDRGALAARLGRSRSAERRRAGAAPASLLVADCLVEGGRSLLARPLSDRRARLARILRPSPHVVALEPFAGSPGELLAAARGLGLAAVLAKDRQGPYLPGMRSRLWLRAAASGRPAAEVAGPVLGGRRPELVALLRLPLG